MAHMFSRHYCHSWWLPPPLTPSSRRSHPDYDFVLRARRGVVCANLELLSSREGYRDWHGTDPKTWASPPPPPPKKTISVVCLTSTRKELRVRRDNSKAHARTSFWVLAGGVKVVPGQRGRNGGSSPLRGSTPRKGTHSHDRLKKQGLRCGGE